MSKRKKRPFKDGIYKITIGGRAPAAVVLTAVIETLLDEIGVSTERLEALGYESGEIQVEVLRILLERREDAYGLGVEAESRVGRAEWPSRPSSRRRPVCSPGCGFASPCPALPSQGMPQEACRLVVPLIEVLAIEPPMRGITSCIPSRIAPRAWSSGGGGQEARADGIGGDGPSREQALQLVGEPQHG